MSPEEGEIQSKGEVIFFPGVAEKEVYREFSTEYAEGMAEQTVETCIRWGLHPSFVPILKQHLNDLNLVVRDDRYDIAEARTGLTVERYSSKPLHDREMTGHQAEVEWGRFLIIDQSELMLRQEMLANIFDRYELAVDQDTTFALGRSALDWLYYEQALVAVANSCYMQRSFGKYIPDFNGQSRWYRAEYTINAEYLFQTEEASKTKINNNVHEDFVRLQRSFGIMMLHHSLLAHDAVNRSLYADWVVETLRKEAPEALSHEEIAYRISCIQPTDSRKIHQRYLDYEVVYIDPLDS